MKYITHSGVFHADEVMATAILNRAIGKTPVWRVPMVKDADPQPDDIIYDIGHGSLDHHQAGGNGVRPNGIPYAACGLVWKTYGTRIDGVDDDIVAAVDADLIQSIDAMDIGICADNDSNIPVVTLSAAIFDFNPAWNDLMRDAPGYWDSRFMAAVEFAGVILRNAIAKAKADREAKSYVDRAVAEAEYGVAVLDTAVPWDRQIFQADPDGNILFVVFPSIRGGWNWQSVPDKPGSFGQRKPCPKKYRGLSGADLDAATGIPGGIFCHAAGFIGGNETREGAIATARLLAAS